MSTNDTWSTFAAVYAAVISTFVLGWDAYKWLHSGPNVRIDTSTGMKIAGGGIPDPKSYISIIAVNNGDRATTITNLGFMYYKSWWKACLCRKRCDYSAIITTPSQAQPLPYRFEAGDQWIGLCEQDDDVDRMVQEGYLFVVLYCSTSGKGIRCLLKRKEHITVQKANRDA
ncbi:hypothetical protein [Leeia aquatica]|uniref:Uncharacterized protein n=1 Tax=Leeia aquatica TaxID=2725557 RepID=A0A847S1I6_9NEIS|nr:hypothetical protein [Leeia aquatica]NLR73583.1 hypothetical protein [Leeia aquatica]